MCEAHENQEIYERYIVFILQMRTLKAVEE